MKFAKDRLQWLVQISTRDDIEDIGGDEIREMARQLLASMEQSPVAWLWSNRKHPWEVTLVRPEDDERASPALWSGWSCQELYASPQPQPLIDAERLELQLLKEDLALKTADAKLYRLALENAEAELQGYRKSERVNAGVEHASEIDRLRALIIRVPMPVIVPRDMAHQLYHTEMKRCRTCNDGLHGGCSTCVFNKQ